MITLKIVEIYFKDGTYEPVHVLESYIGNALELYFKEL
jgi:hypothetical protein